MNFATIRKYYPAVLIFLGVLLTHLWHPSIAQENAAPQQFPLPGQSFADAILQRDTLSNLLLYVPAFDNTCTYGNVVNTQVIQGLTDAEVQDGKILNGYWKELWTLNYCQKQKNFVITFTLDGQGGAYFGIAPQSNP